MRAKAGVHHPGTAGVRQTPLQSRQASVEEGARAGKTTTALEGFAEGGGVVVENIRG
jgi:hypothetical protein